MVMGLALRKDSKWWYGRYEVGGKEFVKNLRVEVRGTRPACLRETGSVQFENSRGEAQSAFDRLMEDIRAGRSNEELAQAVYQARTGRRVERHLLADLPAVWASIPRKRPLNAKYAADCAAMIGKFVGFVGADSVFVDQVRRDQVQAFLESLDASGMTNSRWNKYLDLVRSLLRRCGSNAADDLVNRDEEVVFREPFSIDELDAIFAAAQASDPLVYSLAVTAACTALRKKDCCFLRWSDVDFEAGFVTVKTSKTGVTVDIPLADMLREEIERHAGADSVYVFPEARLQYLSNDTTLSRRLKAVLRLAGFGGGDLPDTECRTDEFDPAVLRLEVKRLFAEPARSNAAAVLEAYLSGKSVRQTAEAVGTAQSTVSLYLNTLEDKTGIRFIRGKRRAVRACAPGHRRGEMTRPRAKGRNAASVRDFHSFRTTFVTLALSNGMPIDTVRLITGHRTAEIVTKHYFRPQRDAIRKAMQQTLPGLLSVGHGARSAEDEKLDRVRELMEGQNAKNWRSVREEVLKVVG